MAWTIEQLLRHPKRDALLRALNTKKEAESTKNNQIISPPTTNVYTGWSRRFFVVPGLPIGKPRMSQRDKWQKRPVVMRYRAYADRVRAAAGTLPLEDPVAILVIAWLPMPKSWSRKRKEAMNGQFARDRPDWDNIGKAAADSLLKEDKVLAGGMCWKFWCWPGAERTEITVLYTREQGIR